jgi:hypothetical protein
LDGAPNDRFTVKIWCLVPNTHLSEQAHDNIEVKLQMAAMTLTRFLEVLLGNGC